jgi:Inner membrane protein YgaP-like, transmembrane domain
MRRNLGMLDRVARVIIGLLLVAYAIPIGFPNTGWNWVGWIGIIPLLTAIVGVCPAYGLLGVSTCSPKPAHR